MTSTYHSAFPALYSTGFMQQKQRQQTEVVRSLAPPKFPSYLKQTLYGKLIWEQYHQRKHEKEQEQQLETLDLRLPTFWNAKDKSKNIQVGSNGLDLSYIGPGKQETHAALARSNFPMRPQCGVFYFEMRVISKGDDGYIGIGFCAATNKLERLPGWDPDSWGYHGDDGHSFAGSGTGKNYGPCFSTGDVIGCGVNFADSSAFYTKNGKFLGYAFTKMNLSKDIFPAIGLRTPGEQVTANFGHEPFVFDIDQYIRDQRMQWIDEITAKEKTTKPVMDQLILSYLFHHGYTGTGKALMQNTGHISGQQLSLSPTDNSKTNGQKDMEERQLIRSAIIHGNIDEAIRLIHLYFPGVLQEEGRGKELQLWLKCGKFVEMMRDYCNMSRKIQDETPLPPPPSPPTNGRRLSYAAIAASLSPSSSSELPKEMTEVDYRSTVNVWGKRPMETHETVDTSSDAAQSLTRVMQYGKTLQDEYRHDTREKTRASLVEIFSLLAYPDPYCSPVAYLMNMSRRDALATEVNAAILAFQHRPEMPAMERIYRQVILCNKELACLGHGQSSLINIDEYSVNPTERHPDYH